MSTVVCLASYFKGVPFLREARALGWRVVLVTKERARGGDWPWDAIDEVHVLPDDAGPDGFVHALRETARVHDIGRVVALEEFDVQPAAVVREHLCLPGMPASTALLFRDKLAMRVAARDAGLDVPDFTPLHNDAAVAAFTSRCPAPWVLKPRTSVSSFGIRRIGGADELWHRLGELQASPRPDEQRGHFLLEAFVPGDVYHVDSLSEGGEVVFAGVHRYGRPPMEVMHGGGVFVTQTVRPDAPEHGELLALNRRLLAALGLRRGAAHAEFIRQAHGGFAFLEVGARVGGAYVSDVLEAASGINLWREWARVELLADAGEWALPAPRHEYAGLVLSLARQEHPDTSAYADPEVALRIERPHHAGLIVRSPDPDRVDHLLADYARRFEADFVATLPPPAPVVR